MPCNRPPHQTDLNKQALLPFVRILGNHRYCRFDKAYLKSISYIVISIIGEKNYETFIEEDLEKRIEIISSIYDLNN